ncbi:MAG: Tail-specific protease [Chlamydiae bacterium]|nr:Tail-specific protease [Chlamydiota bacterium]
MLCDMRNFKFFFLFFLFPLFLLAKAPDLTNKDVHVILNQIFREHAKYKELDEKIAQRALHLFIEELDLAKVYFTHDEVMRFLKPSKELTRKVVHEFKNKEYKTFFTICALMAQAIKRKEEFSKALKAKHLPNLVQVEEFKNMEFAKNTVCLLERQLRLKGLQYQAMKKLDEDLQDKYLERVEKYERNFEEQILEKDEKKRSNFVYSNILKAVAASLDAHTHYLTPQEATQFMIQVQGKVFGIGAQLQDDLNGLTITKIMKGGPCEKHGSIHLKDRIVAVDKEPIVGWSILDAVALIRGEKGKSVQLTIIRKDKDKKEQKLDVEIIRDEIVIEEIRLEKEQIPFGDGVIGYFRLHSFYEDLKTSSAKDIEKGIKEMQKKNLHGVILDLRDNSGGLLPSAIDVTSLFIRKGVVVSMKDNDGKIMHFRNLNAQVAYLGPLIVLVNKLSASGSEIVAQALQDYGRALIVGETSFGKGTAQMFTLDGSATGKVNPKGEFKVTKGVYYTVSGKSPQLVGVKPDIEMLGITNALELSEEFSKYPLENDQIQDHFDDELADIPFFQRQRLKEMYKIGRQKKEDLFAQYLDTLKTNQKVRTEKDQDYQAFLKALKNNDENYELKMRDFQKEEAVALLKDFIFMQQFRSTKAA